MTKQKENGNDLDKEVKTMKISSAEFTKLTLQQVADMLIDSDHHTAICKGMVDGRMYSLKVELIVDE